MLVFDSNIQYYSIHCQQCGTCIPSCPKQALTNTTQKNGCSIIEVDHKACVKCGICVKVCPVSKTTDQLLTADKLLKHDFFLANNADDSIRSASSSGGVAKTIIVEGLRQELFDGAYTLGKCDEYPYYKGKYYSKKSNVDYSDIPNSVYHSVMLGFNIGEIPKCDHLLLVGTQCQLNSIKAALSKRCRKITTVSIFCKQQKTLDSTKFIAKMLGTKVQSNHKFTSNYRGKGWPGIVIINDKELDYDSVARLPFGHRLWTVPGCNICSDPFNFSADLSLMDPWKIQQPNTLGQTLVLSNSKWGRELLGIISNLNVKSTSFNGIEEALDIQDIRRKQILVPYYLGKKVSFKVKFVGTLDRLHRRTLETFMTYLPRLPLLAYKIINKMPNPRSFLR